VAEACRQAAVDPAAVERALGALPATAPSEAEDVTRWPVGRLIDYIVTTHHTYVRTALPVITRYLAKLVDVHGQRHPELERAAAAFSLLSSDLTFHMLKEEHVLFPYLRELGAGHTLSSPFGSVENPISMMEREHRQAGDELRVIRELTNGYTPPDDGCTTYRVCFAELAAFERDLHRHVHLENNVLFPKAIELERAAEAASA